MELLLTIRNLQYPNKRVSQNITVLVLSYYIYKECWKSLNQLNFSHKCKAVGSDS